MLEPVERKLALRIERDSDILTVEEVADWLRVTRGWVLDHAAKRRRPHLPSLKFGRKVVFCRGDIKKWLDEVAKRAA